MPIQILPARLANQIAAGEVVERPASVVKELVENSLDAGASQIDIEIEKGGHKKILIRDNGCGIDKTELSLALSRHATSKISCLDDLEQIASLGFRGEALASVSSVARLNLTSKTQTQSEAWLAHAEGRDMTVELTPAAHPQGTSVEVLDLFFNTPARRKFLRTEKTEFAHIDEVIRRIALSRFDVGFSLKHNGKILRKYPVAQSQQSKVKRLANICGEEFAQSALTVTSQYQQLTLNGWVAGTGGHRSQNDLQYFYVNGRMMRDKLINHAIRQAFEGLIPSESYPAFVLYLEIDPQQVDVNVHPAKHEVRFHQARLVHDFIYRALTDAIEQSLDASVPDSEFTELPAVQPSHDYIRPLQVEEQSQQSRPITRAGTGQSSGYKPKPSVSPQAAHNYQSLMSAQSGGLHHDSPTQSDSLNPDILVISSDSLLINTTEGFYLVTAQKLRVQQTLAIFNQSVPVSQPLLMPISLVADSQLISNAQTLYEPLLALSIEIGWAKDKILLRKVPAGFRQLSWTNILPKILLESAGLNDDALLNKVVIEMLSEQQQEPLQSIRNLWQWFIDTHKDDWLRQVDNLAVKVPLEEWLKQYV